MVGMNPAFWKRSAMRLVFVGFKDDGPLSKIYTFIESPKQIL